MADRRSWLARHARRRALVSMRKRNPMFGFWLLLGLSALLLTLSLMTSTYLWSTAFVIGVNLGFAFMELERWGFKQLLEEAREPTDEGEGESRSGDRSPSPG